jgi:mannose-1-phosphate guanylyltransferase
LYSENSLLEETISHFHPLLDSGSDISIVVLEKSLVSLEKQGTLKRFGIPEENLVILPSSKGSAWATWRACRVLLESNKLRVSDPIVVTPSDQFYWPKDTAIFHLGNLIMGADSFPDNILALCIPPGGPAPSMNYFFGDWHKMAILGVPIDDVSMDSVQDIAISSSTLSVGIDAYKSTPDYDTAKDLIGDKWLWDLGVYAGKLGIIKSGIEKALDIEDSYRQFVWTSTSEDLTWDELPNKSFANDVIPIAVANKLIVGALIPKIVWSTLDNWVSVKHLLYDSQIFQNTPADGTHLVESIRNLVFKPPGKTVALYGVDDLIVIDVGDKLLIGTPGGLHEYF